MSVLDRFQYSNNRVLTAVLNKVPTQLAYETLQGKQIVEIGVAPYLYGFEVNGFVSLNGVLHVSVTPTTGKVNPKPLLTDSGERITRYYRVKMGDLPNYLGQGSSTQCYFEIQSAGRTVCVVLDKNRVSETMDELNVAITEV